MEDIVEVIGVVFGVGVCGDDGVVGVWGCCYDVWSGSWGGGCGCG